MLNCAQKLIFNMRLYEDRNIYLTIKSKLINNDSILLSTDLRYIIHLFNIGKIKTKIDNKNINGEYTPIISTTYIAFKHSGHILPSIVIYPKNIDHIINVIRKYWKYCEFDNNLEVKTIRYHNHIAKYKDGKLINI